MFYKAFFGIDGQKEEEAKQSQPFTEWYFHYVGFIPNNIDVVGVCRRVFDVMYENQLAMNDLGLPDQCHMNPSFEHTINRVSFEFFCIVDENKPLPVSETLNTHSNVSDTSVVANAKVYYHAYEQEERKEIIEARIVYVATHALRYAMIRNSNLEMVPVEKKFCQTPAKSRSDRMFEKSRNEPLYMLKKDEFHAGHWMEHFLLGGVWITLFGQILDAQGNVCELGRRGMGFKVVKKLPDENVYYREEGMGGVSVYECLFGYTLQDSDQPVRIHHVGDHHGGEDRGCGRDL